MADAPLTPERWAEELEQDGVTPLAERVRWACDEIGAREAVTPLGLASLALHVAANDGAGGFTWEDADLLFELAEMLPRSATCPAERDALRDLADRIAALLPPRAAADDETQ